jgi:hypothetical protein
MPADKTKSEATTMLAHDDSAVRDRSRAENRPRSQHPYAREYSLLLGVYSLVATIVLIVLRRRRDSVHQLTGKDLILLVLATQHLSRLIAKDSITSAIRSPFTSFIGEAGEGEVNEVPSGAGMSHVIGELLTCPFCLAQWIASALVAGSTVAPNFTSTITTICALARSSDYLQLAYAHLRKGV